MQVSEKWEETNPWWQRETERERICIFYCIHLSEIKRGFRSVQVIFTFGCTFPSWREGNGPDSFCTKDFFKWKTIRSNARMVKNPINLHEEHGRVSNQNISPIGFFTSVECRCMRSVLRCLPLRWPELCEDTFSSWRQSHGVSSWPDLGSVIRGNFPLILGYMDKQLHRQAGRPGGRQARSQAVRFGKSLYMVMSVFLWVEPVWITPLCEIPNADMLYAFFVTFIYGNVTSEWWMENIH